MENQQDEINVTVNWRDKKLKIDIALDATVEELGLKLLKLINVKPDTVKLLMPGLGNRGTKVVYPFLEDHSSTKLNQYGLVEGRSVKMLGVFVDEIEEVSQNGTKGDLRIAGFAEEEERLRRRMADTGPSLKMPQGRYKFYNFRTLEIPGLELYPPPSEALLLMHTLASDQGIVAIMEKYRWQVELMTEMAPVGYVGISPKCILGFNKNQGEEISLRLRTDDLKGFRKYETIKKTLLHELAHMVYSEHDKDFYAFDKQLNDEVVRLDWTKSKSYTLYEFKGRNDSVRTHSAESISKSLKLGGGSKGKTVDARSLSVQAAYLRLRETSGSSSGNSLLTNNKISGSESDLVSVKPSSNRAAAFTIVPDSNELSRIAVSDIERNSNDYQEKSTSVESGRGDTIVSGAHSDVTDALQAESLTFSKGKDFSEPDPDDSHEKVVDQGTDSDDSIPSADIRMEPDPDEKMQMEEPDPDDMLEEPSATMRTASPASSSSSTSNSNGTDEDNGTISPDLQIIHDPVMEICLRLRKAIEMLISGAPHIEANSVIRTLSKIVQNIIEHPEERKYRLLRKANAHFQKSVANHEAAMEVLTIIGFREDIISDRAGKTEEFMVLKREDPALLWLAKSTLESYVSNCNLGISAA